MEGGACGGSSEGRGVWREGRVKGVVNGGACGGRREEEGRDDVREFTM